MLKQPFLQITLLHSLSATNIDNFQHVDLYVFVDLFGAIIHDVLNAFRYLTMDQTRKLLLLLETDPKADSLPLVGM